MKKETKYLIGLAALIGLVLFFVFKQKQESDKKSDTDKKEPKENKESKSNDTKGDDTNASDDGETVTHKSGVMSSIASTKFPNRVTAPVIINCCSCNSRGTYIGKPVADKPPTIDTGWYDKPPTMDTGRYDKPPTIDPRWKDIPPAMSERKKYIPPVSIGEVKALQYEQLESNGKQVRML